MSTKAVASVIEGSTQGQSNEDKDLPAGVINQQSSLSVEAGTETRCSGLEIKWEERRYGQIPPLRSLDRKRKQEIGC